jgi:hypothetical protein
MEIIYRKSTDSLKKVHRKYEDGIEYNHRRNMKNRNKLKLMYS